MREWELVGGPKCGQVVPLPVGQWSLECQTFSPPPPSLLPPDLLYPISEYTTRHRYEATSESTTTLTRGVMVHVRAD